VVKAPSEGDLIEIDDAGTTGHEQKGRRPALVVSIPEFQETGFALVCPVTTHGGTSTKPRSDLEIGIPAGFAVTGVILSHHIRNIDWKGPQRRGPRSLAARNAAASSLQAQALPGLVDRCPFLRTESREPATNFSCQQGHVVSL